MLKLSDNYSEILSTPSGASAFDDAFIEKFNKKLDQILKSGWKENLRDPNNYGAHFEKTLLNRIAEYRRNYFLWAEISLLDVKKSKDYWIINRYSDIAEFRENYFFYVSIFRYFA